MLTTSIGKKIKILAKKPDPAPVAAQVPIAAPVMAETPYGAPHPDVAPYQMEVDDGYDALGGSYGYGGYVNVDDGLVAGTVTGNRKRKPVAYGDYDLSSSIEAPPVKKRAGKATSSRGPRAHDAAYSPSAGGGGGRLRASGALTASGGVGTPRGNKLKNSDVYVSPAPSRRQAPPGSLSSRRELNGTAMAACYDLVAELMALPEAPPFNQPVNPEALGIPNYFQIITHPMDLRTVKEKVKRNRYVSMREFTDDVRLIWRNATRFNSADTPVHQMAIALSNYFEQRVPDITAKVSAVDPHFVHGQPSSSYLVSDASNHWGTPATTTTRYAATSQQTPTRAASTQRTQAPKTSSRPQRAAAQHDPKRVQYEDRIKALTASLKAAENQLANLKKNGYNQALNRAIDALAAKEIPRSFEVSDTSAMPYPLKASMAHVLRTMTDVTHVRQITRILMEEQYGFPRHGTEVAMSLDEMTPIMLRRIEHYIRTQVPDGPVLLETPAPEEPLAPPASVQPRKLSGPTASTYASSTDESMLVDVLGVDPAPPVVNHSVAPVQPSALTSSGAKHPPASAAAPSRAAPPKPTSKPATKPHAMLDESDSDTSDSDSDEEDLNPNLLLRSSTRVLDIVPATATVPKDVEIKNISSWTNFDASSAATANKSPMRPMTPGSATTTPGGMISAEAESTDGEGAGGATWDSFRNMDALNKQRDRERQELEERQKREREEREREAKLEEERKRVEAELAIQRAAEEEKARREAELKARRDAERQQREAASENPGLDMMAQSLVMRDLEKQLRHGS
jgi:hypothetical protein